MSVATKEPGAAAIRPFSVDIPAEGLEELRRRIAAVRWPFRELISDPSQGVQLATIQALARCWVTGHEWRRSERRLNAPRPARPPTGLGPGRVHHVLGRNRRYSSHLEQEAHC